MTEESFGIRLKKNRKQRKITQTELAKAIDVHPGTVSHWENGKQLPDTFTIQKTAEYLGIPLEKLLSGIGYARSHGEKNSDVKLEELVSQLKALSSKSLQIIAPAIRAAYEMEQKSKDYTDLDKT